MRLAYLLLFKLNGVHKIALHLVENQDADGENHEHKGETIGQPAPSDELACAQSTMLEGIQHGRDRVEEHQRIEVDAAEDLSFHLAERIDDGGGIHPQRDEKRKKHLKIAVFRGHRRDDDAKTQGQPCQHHHKQWEKQQIAVGRDNRTRNGIENIDHDE